MLSTLLLVVLAWAITVPAVLGLARLLGRWSAPQTGEPAAAAAPSGDVVPLVPRPQNALVPVHEPRRAA